MKNKLSILIIMTIILLSLSACGTDSKSDLYDLMEYKDSYVGNNSAVGNIIAMLPANAYGSGFSLQTETEPYGITINYSINQKLGEENYNKFWSDKKINEFLEKNAVVLFALVKNVDVIEFNVDQIGEEQYEYNRKSLEEKYGEDLKKMFPEKMSFENFLN